MSNNVLLKTLLLSTSSINQIKYETDKKKRGKVVGQLVGKLILYAMFLGFCLIIALGLGGWGFGKAIPAFCVTALSLMEFVFCLLKTNGFMFAFNDYDMIMALPFSVKKIVASRFLYMYIKNLPWVLIISLPMMVGYGIFVKPFFTVYIVWTLFSFLIPMIPMVIATVIGTLIAAIGSGFRHKNIVQIILTFAVVLFFFALRFIIDDVLSNDKIAQTMSSISGSMDKIKSIYRPALWFEKSITELNVLHMLLFVASAVVVFELAFFVISKFYRQINSRLMAGAARKKYRLKGLKSKSVVHSIVFKEFKHFVSSTNYIVNQSIGIVLCVILCVLSLILGLEKILMFFTKGHYVDLRIILPAVPALVFFLIGMSTTTTISYSLEGKNYWIVQSLPISLRTLINGKMLFNLYLTLPISILGNLILSMQAKGNPLEVTLCVVCGIIQCLYCTSWGMLLGLLLPKMEWKVDIEVIKNSAAQVIYMIPNMLITMAVGVVSVILGLNFGPIVPIVATTLFYALFAGITYIFVLMKTKSPKTE